MKRALSFLAVMTSLAAIAVAATSWDGRYELTDPGQTVLPGRRSQPPGTNPGGNPGGQPPYQPPNTPLPPKFVNPPPPSPVPPNPLPTPTPTQTPIDPIRMVWISYQISGSPAGLYDVQANYDQGAPTSANVSLQPMTPAIISAMKPDWVNTLHLKIHSSAGGLGMRGGMGCFEGEYTGPGGSLFYPPQPTITVPMHPCGAN